MLGKANQEDFLKLKITYRLQMFVRIKMQLNEPSAWTELSKSPVRDLDNNQRINFDVRSRSRFANPNARRAEAESWAVVGTSERERPIIFKENNNVLEEPRAARFLIPLLDRPACRAPAKRQYAQRAETPGRHFADNKISRMPGGSLLSFPIIDSWLWTNMATAVTMATPDISLRDRGPIIRAIIALRRK